jgi:hypothetical protein
MDEASILKEVAVDDFEIFVIDLKRLNIWQFKEKEKKVRNVSISLEIL